MRIVSLGSTCHPPGGDKAGQELGKMWEVQVQPMMDEGSPVLSICEERLHARVAENFGHWVLALHSAKGQIIRKSNTV